MKLLLRLTLPPLLTLSLTLLIKRFAVPAQR